MSDSYEVDVVIKADSSEAESAFGRVGDGLSEWGINLDKLYDRGAEVFKKFGIDVDTFAGKLGTTGPALTGMVAGVTIAIEAIKKLAEFVGECTKEFAEDETAQLKFNAALTANNKITEEGRKTLQEFAEAFGLMTGQTTAATQSQIAMLAATGRTDEEIKKLMQTAQGMANEGIGSMESNLTQLNATFEGSRGRLAKYSESIKEMSEDQLKNGDAVDVLNKKYGGFADVLAGSSAVSMSNYKNQLGELKSELGKMFEEIIKPIRDVLTQIIEYLLAHKTEIEAVIRGIALAFEIILSGGLALIPIFLNMKKSIDDIKKAHDDATDAAKKYNDQIDWAEQSRLRAQGATERAQAAEKKNQEDIKKVVDEYNKSIADTEALRKAGLISATDAHDKERDSTQKAAESLVTLGATGTDSYKKIKAALNEYSTVAIDWSKKTYDANSLYEDRIAKDTQNATDKRNKSEQDLETSREKLYLETSDANSLYEDRIAKVTADTAEKTTEKTKVEEEKKKKLYLDNATTITSIIQSMASDISAIILGNTEDIAKNFAKMAADMATNIGKLFGPAGSAVGGIISGVISIGTAIADMFGKSKKDAEDAKKNMIAAELEYESAVLNAQKEMLDQQLKNEQARLAAQTSALDKEKNAALVAAGLTEDTRQQDLKDSIADINKQLLAETDAEKIKALQKQKIIDEFEIKKQNASDESAKKQAEIAYESAVVQQKIEIAKAKIDRESARLAAWAAHEGEGADAQQTAADASNALFDELISLLSTPIPTPAAEGAIVTPKSGGTLMQLGEGGKTEVVFPLDKLENFMTKGTIDYTAGYRMLGGLGADSVHLPSSRSSATGASAGSGRSSSTGTTIGNIIINSPKTNTNDSVRIMKRQMQQLAFMGNI